MGDPGKQLMYGTDWPLVKMIPYLKFMDELDFDDAQLENICWKTAARLFKLDEATLDAARARRLAP